MLKRFIPLASVASFCLSATVVAAPKVSVDIAPLHSLVAQVMDGVATPSLLIQPESSPHGYNMRPSEARALSQSEVIFWVDEGLTPWLEDSIDSLAPNAISVAVADLEGTVLHPFREGATFESHDHHDEEEHHDEEHHDEEHHDEHGSFDPHVWLDPSNAKHWLTHIAKVLSKQDPANAAQYQANAEKSIKALEVLMNTLEMDAKNIQGIEFVVFHDAYQYFEQRFNLSAAGSISLGDASDPSPARIREIHNKVKALQISCVFTEPQFNPKMVETVFEGSVVKTLGVIDPFGSSYDVGVEHYAQVLSGLMTSLKSCKD